MRYGKNWQDAGYERWEAQEWQDRHFTFLQAQRCRAANLTPEEADEWREFQPRQARQLIDAGITFQQAHHWREVTGLRRTVDVIKWAKDFTPEEAKPYIDQDINYQEARRLKKGLATPVSDATAEKVVAFGREIVVVHDLNEYTPEQIATIPEPMEYIGREDELEKFAYAYNHNESVLWEGPSGGGKTDLVLYFAYKVKVPVYQASINTRTTTDDLIGTRGLDGMKTVWQDGLVTMGVRNGGIILLDELNAAKSNILFPLHPMMDTRGHLALLETGEIVKRHPWTRVVGTQNPSNDPMYHGTTAMNRAFLDRFDMYLTMDYLPRDEEIEVLLVNLRKEGKELPYEQVAKMVDCGNDIRELVKKRIITYPITTRSLIRWALKAERFGYKESAEMAFLNRIPDKRDRAEEFINQHFGI